MDLNFSVFREKILDGTKTQTIRLLRGPVPRVGEPLRLYWKPPGREREPLGTFPCSEVLVKSWGELKDDLELARRDGFETLEDFRRWFSRYDPTDETKFVVIRWEFRRMNVKANQWGNS